MDGRRGLHGWENILGHASGVIIPPPGRLGAWRLTVQRSPGNAIHVGVAARSESPVFPAHRLSTHRRIPNGHQEKLSIAEQSGDFARGAGSEVVPTRVDGWFIVVVVKDRSRKQHGSHIPDGPERRTHLGAMKAVRDRGNRACEQSGSATGES